MQNQNTNNADRLKTYRQRMKAAGFVQLNLWLHPDALAALNKERTTSDCYGRLLERLLVGEPKPRPWQLEMKARQRAAYTGHGLLRNYRPIKKGDA